MRIELDLSPGLINATAMGYVTRDAAEALQGADLGFSWFGEALAAPPDAITAGRLRAKLDALLAAAADGRAPVRPEAAAGPAPGLRRVFLDPLYVLFSEVTQNDVVLILDMSAVTTPAWHAPAVAALYTQAFSRIARAGPQLLAISDNTAQTYCANYGYPRREVRTIPLYVPDHLLRPERPDWAAACAPSPEPYMLFAGSLEARKNVAGAIAAFGLSGLAAEGWRFILAGGEGHGAELAHAAAAVTPGVALAGRVSDAELQRLYAGAQGFVYPSFLEGFGVPLLEALYNGLPAVASVTGACPEVGGDLVSYCDPDDHAAIAEAIRAMAALTPQARADHARRARAPMPRASARPASRRRSAAPCWRPEPCPPCPPAFGCRVFGRFCG